MGGKALMIVFVHKKAQKREKLKQSAPAGRYVSVFPTFPPLCAPKTLHSWEEGSCMFE